jgi:hypothetical protein
MSDDGLNARNEFEKMGRKLPILVLHPSIFLEELTETTRNSEQDFGSRFEREISRKRSNNEVYMHFNPG